MSERDLHPAAAALERLEHVGGSALRRLPGEQLATAWFEATARLRHELPAALERSLLRASGLSPEGFAAALEVVLAGVRTDACRALLADTPPPAEPRRPALAILPSNVPGLALQCLLPALAARRPLLLKSPSAEAEFAPFLIERLVRAEPRLAPALSATTWAGGDREVEDEVLRRAQRVVAYGGDGALTDLRARTAGGPSLTAHGHKISLALVVPESRTGLGGLELPGLAEALARDVALFDQRGCLSVHSVLVLDPSGRVAQPLAEALADALRTAAERWPPGPGPAPAQGEGSRGVVARVRALRDEAVMSGCWLADLPLRSGTVLCTPPGDAREGGPCELESPGLRTVRVVPARSPDQLLRRLEPWRGRLQGLAIGQGLAIQQGLALVPGDVLSAEFRRHLESLGFSRMAPAGELQAVDAAGWHNGGLSPLDVYS